MATKTVKSHKSRKTVPVSAPAGRTSPAPQQTQPPDLPPNPLSLVLQRPQGDGVPAAQPPASGTPTPDPADNVPAPAAPEKQWWYRPADSKARKLVEKIVVMDAAGHTSKEIAKRLHTTEASVNQYRYIGKKNGWLKVDDESGELEVVDLEAELAMNVDRKIVRNIDASLDGQMTNWQTHEMTIAAAKGRGIFKNNDKAEGITAMPVVAIQVVMPAVGAGDQKVNEDNIGGTPAYVEGEVVAKE